MYASYVAHFLCTAIDNGEVLRHRYAVFGDLYFSRRQSITAMRINGNFGSKASYHLGAESNEDRSEHSRSLRHPADLSCRARAHPKIEMYTGCLILHTSHGKIGMTLV